MSLFSKNTSGNTGLFSGGSNNNNNKSSGGLFGNSGNNDKNNNNNQNKGGLFGGSSNNQNQQKKKTKMSDKQKLEKYLEKREEIARSRTPFDKAKWNSADFLQLFNTVSGPKFENQLNELLSMDDIRMKYSQLAGYFKPYKDIDVKKLLEEKKIQGLFNKFKLTPPLEMAIKKVAEDINLNVYQTFRIVEDYIFENVKLLMQINKGIEPALLNKITIDCGHNYFFERGSALKTLSTILFYSHKTSLSYNISSANHKFAHAFIEDLVQNRHLFKNLWINYKKLKTYKIPNAFKEQEVNFYNQILSEQIWILRIMYRGLNYGIFECDEAIFLEIFKTFREDDFVGQFRKISEEIGLEAEKFRDKCQEINHYSGLVLIAALNLDSLIQGDMENFVRLDKAPLKLFTSKSIGEISDMINEIVDDNNSDLIIRVGHVLKALITFFDVSGGRIRELKEEGKIKQDQEKLKDLHRALIEKMTDLNTAGEVINDEYAIRGLIDSPFYKRLPHIESNEVRMGIKKMVGLKILPKSIRDDSSFLSFEYHELTFIGDIIAECLKNETELSDYINNERNPFRNFERYLYSYFPIYEEILAKLLKRVAGNQKVNDGDQIISDLASMSTFSVQKVYKQIPHRIVQNSNQYETTQEYQLQNGPLIPAGTNFTIIPGTECSIFSFPYSYNYLHVIWKDWTNLVVEGLMKGASIDERLAGYIKLVCKIIEIRPNLAYIIQSHLLNQQDEEINREDRDQFIAPLLFLMLDTLCLLSESVEEVSLTLALMKALNAILLTSFNTQATVAIQVYQSMSISSFDHRKTHPLISLVNLFHRVESELRGQSSKMLKPCLLVLEVTKLFETVLNISDYIYETMPSVGFYNKQKMTQIRRNEKDLKDFIEVYYQFMNNEANVDYANELNLAYKRVLEVHGTGSGCLLAPTTFIEDGLKMLVKDFLSYFQDSRFDAYETCIEVKYLIGYKLMAILNNLLRRFKIEPGRELTLNSGSSESIELQQIASFFNSINLPDFLFQIFDVSIKNDIFLGEKEAIGRVNKLGIENLLWARQELISNISHVNFALQRFLVESLQSFNIVIELIKQRKFYMSKSGNIQLLNLVHDMTNSLCDPDKLFSYRLKSAESDFQINFFLSLMLMSDFNFEKSIPGLESHHPDFYFIYYSRPTTDSYILYDLFVIKNFELSLNYSSIYSSGRYTQVYSTLSISQAAIETVSNLVNLWGNVRSFKKPILNHILIGNGVSNNFAGKIKTYIYKNIINHLYRTMKRPYESAAALEFLVECFKSQKSFFDGFIKYSAKLRNRTPALNELVDIFKSIIGNFKSIDPDKLLSSNAFSRIIIAMTQIVAIVFLRGDIYHELTDQIRKYVLQPLAELLTDIMINRRDPFEAVLSCSIDTLIGADNTFCEINNSFSNLSIIMLKIREVVDLETKLNFTLALFLKVARSEFFFKARGQDAYDKHTEIKPPLFDSNLIEVMNHLMNISIIKIDKVLNEIDVYFLKNYINDGNVEDGMMEEEGGLSKYGLIMFREQRVASNKKISLLEPDYDAGIEFDGKDTLRKLRESGYSSEKINTVLYAISFYNHLSQLKTFRYSVIDECNSNLTLASSLGFNGIMFSSILHQDPLSNVVRFVVSLQNQSGNQNSLFKNMPENEHIYSPSILGFDDVSISNKMKQIINPFYSNTTEESLIKLLDAGQGTRMSEKTLSVCLSKLCKHIGEMRKTADELISTFEDEIKSKEMNLVPYQISKILSDIASNYFVAMGHIVSNLYYLKSEDIVEKSEESLYTILSFLGSYNKLGDYLKRCFSTMSIDIYSHVHCIFTALCSLSHFKQKIDSNYIPADKSLIHIVILLENIIYKKGQSSELFSLALNCFNLVLDIEPDYLTKDHVERLLKTLTRADISDADYMSICQFLITCYSCPQRKRVTIESRILQSLMDIAKFNRSDSFSDATFYNKELRNSKQMVWCWTIQLAIVSFNAVSSMQIRFKYAVSFLNKYQNRIMMILSYKFQDIEKVFQNDRKLDIGIDTTQSLPFRTNAYLEELELTMTLVSIVMKNSLDFKKINKNLFEMIFYLLTNRTVLLFKRDNCSPDTFKAVSWLETALQKINIGGSGKEKMMSMARNPSTIKKMTARKSSYRSDFGGNRSIRSRADLYAGAYSRIYTPDLFSFKTEIQFLNIVFLLFDCLVYSIEHSEFYNYFNTDQDEFYLDNKSKSKNVKVVYQDSFWKHFSNALVEVQSYLVSSLMKLGSHNETYKEGIIQLMVYNHTIENSFNNFVLNILNPNLKISKLQDMSFAALEMSMYIQNVVFQHLDNLSIYGSSKMIESIRVDKIKSSNLINELQWLEKKSYALKSSIVKNSINSNLDLPTVEEEESEDRYFLAFMKKYYLN